MATKLQVATKESVAWLTFFEEEERKPCTLDWEVLAQLEQAIDKIAADAEVRAVVIQSASPKSFIVGANIAVLKTLDAQNIPHWVKNGHRIFGKLQLLAVPVIAKVESYALGGGLELAMACDIIVATRGAMFAQPEASLGVMPGWGGSCRLASLIGPNRAKEMFFTGKMIDAQQAYEWGLVNHLCDKDALNQTVAGLIDAICKNDPMVLGLVKEIVNNHTQSGMGQNAFEEATTSAVCMASPTTQNRLQDFFNARKK